MAKKKKFEKIDQIVTYDGDGNITRQTLTGKTGGYTLETTPALSAVAQTVKPSDKTSPLVTVGKTLGNIATGMGTGALKSLEGVADFVSDQVTNPIEQKINYAYDYLTKGKKVAKENIKDLVKMQERDIKKNRTEEFLNKTGFNDIADEWEKGSLVKRGNFAGQVAQGVGGMVPSLIMGGALGGEAALTDLSKLTGKEKALAALGNVGKTYASQLPANAVLGASSYGSGMEEALNEGANIDQARKFGLANMAIEQGTEMLTGGVPGLQGKGGLDSLVEPLVDKNTKGLTKAALKTLYRAGGEGLEESAAALLNPIAKKIYSDEEIDWNQVGKQALQEGLVGAATGAILNSPQTMVDFNQARMDNKMQKVQNLNDVQRNALIEVTNKRKQGIPLDQNDYAVIGAINNTVNNVVDAQRGQNFGENLQLQNTINPTTLQESATQYGYKGDAEQIANVQTMLDNRGIQSKFDASMFNDNDTNALWMVDENGNRQVVFNPNANENDIIEEVSVHELAHDIMASENSKIALKPQEVLDFVKTLEGYEQARLDLEDTYSQIYDKNSPEFQSLIDEEVVADFLGKRLGNQEYVTQLTNSNPSFARKIYNWVVDKLNSIVNSGGNVRSERLYWQNIKNNFEKAYNMEYQSNANENISKYHVSKDFAKEINQVLDGTYNSHNQVKARDYTPKILVDNGIKDLPMLMTARHIRNTILTDSEAQQQGLTISKKDHYHGLGKETLIKAIDSMDNPLAIYKQSDDNYLVITELKDKNNKTIIVPIKIDGKGSYNNVYIDENQIKTVYGHDDLEGYLKYNNFEQIYAKKRTTLNEGVKSHNIGSSDNKISQNDKNVKASISKGLDNSSFSIDKNKINKLTNNGITMTYVRNPNSNANTLKNNYKNVGLDFGQDIEPSGEYMSMDTMEGKNKINGYEYGTIQFNKPLVIDNSDTTSKGWKKILSEKYNNLTGEKLSKAIKNDGYDAIMARDENGNITEVVNLNGTKFESNQFKNIDDTKPTQNPDIRYSISKKTGKLQDGNGNEVNIKTTQSANDKNLMVMHGLSVDNLKNVLSLGGLPVPSLGITNTKYADVFDEFGGPDGAVLLFSKDTINPKIKGNEVYSRDVYSKTVPEIYQKVDKRTMNKVMDEFRPYESEYGTFNKHDYSKSSLDGIVNDLSYSTAAKAKFLDDNGYKFDKAYRGYKSSYGFTEEVIDKFLRENPDLATFNPKSADTTTEVENIAPRVKEAAIDMMAESNPKVSRKQLETLFKDKWYFNDVVQFYRDINGYRNLNGQKEFDIYTTRDNIDAAVEPHKQEFEDWLRNKFKDVYGDKYFENDSGRAKEYTLENLTSYMKKGNTQAQQKGMFDTFSIGQAKGGAAQQFKTIEQIREASSKLVDADTYKERHKAFEDIDEDVRTDIGDTRISKGEDLFDVYSDYYMALSKAASGVDPETALKNNYFTDLSKEQIEKFAEISQALADLPAKYFEAKPQRAVGLDEIKGIAVPNTIDAELREQLLNNGFTLAEYDPKVEGDKQRVINQFDDLKFSKQSEGWDSFLDRNVKSEGTKTRLKDLKTPRENKSVSESREGKTITVKNKQGQELKLKQDKTNPNVYEREVKIPKDNKSIVPKETMQKQLAKLKDGTKVSNFYSNLTENSKFITQENANNLSQEEIWRYAPQTNKETMENASKIIGDTQKSLESAYGDFLSKTENFSPEDVGVGWILLKRFQDAGNYDAMVQVAKKMRNIATKSGQTVQMFNLQSRLTPEGMVKYAQSELMEAEQQFNKGKSQKEIDKYAKDFELTGEEVEFIKNQMEKIQGMEDGRAKNIEMAKINKMLSDKLPHQRGDSIKAWMRMSMLFNPKTQVRNIVGNALITPINAIADVPAAIADKAISRKTGTRTIGAPSLSGLATYGKGFAKGGVEALQDYRMGLDTKDVDMSRFDVTQKNPFIENHEGLASVLNPVSKTLNKANSLLDLVMSGGDRVFYQGAFDASLRNQMKLNNVDVPTQDMIDIATQEALARTWNDNNGYTQFVLNTRRALNKASIKGYGLGDVLIPFAKTPANLTKAIFDYSPVGLANTIFKTKQISNAIETGQITPQMQHNFAQNIGKGVAGSMLYVLAYALAKAGISSGSSDDDKDVANFIKNTMGIQPYSIKIGDKTFTYDWAQPIAAPISIAADAYQNLTKDSDEDTATRIFNTILDVSNTGFNVLMQQSFLQGISEVLNSNEGVMNGIMEEVIGLPARGVPTFVQQINNMFDKTQRVAFEKNQPLKTGKQNVMSKIPGQSKKLAPRVDALGNEVQRYGDSENEITYALKNFLSPANQSNRKTSKAAEEIYRVYEATGDKTIMPMVAPYYIQNKTVGRIDLDSKDRATYQKISGKLVNDAVEELTRDSNYRNLSNDEKAEVLNGIVSYSNAKAKEHFTGFMANTYNPANKKINNGMSIADYYLEKTMNKR